MQFCQRCHGTNNLLREKPNQRGHYAGKLDVSCGEIAWSVQFIKKKPSRPRKGRLGQEVGITSFEARVLELLNRQHACRQSRVGRARMPFGSHSM